MRFYFSWSTIIYGLWCSIWMITSRKPSLFLLWVLFVEWIIITYLETISFLTWSRLLLTKSYDFFLRKRTASLLSMNKNNDHKCHRAKVEKAEPWRSFLPCKILIKIRTIHPIIVSWIFLPRNFPGYSCYFKRGHSP